MTTKYTPGPWAVHGEWITRADAIAESGKNEYGYQSGHYIARIVEPIGGETVRKANAHLIAAAPDILAALEDFVTSGVEFDDDRIGYITVQVNRITLRDARAAIAKAEGATP